MEHINAKSEIEGYITINKNTGVNLIRNKYFMYQIRQIIIFKHNFIIMKTNLLKITVITFALLCLNSTLYISDTNSQWVQSNYNLYGKNIQTLAVSGDTIFAGTFRAGFFYTTNTGENWIQFTGISPDIRTILIEGSNIYLGGYDGVYVSTNRGNNWTGIGFSGGNYCPIAVSGNTIYAGGYGNGVYFTTNNGAQWIQTTLNNKYVYSLMYKGDNIIAGTNTGIYVSSDFGITWTNPLTAGTIYNLKLSGENIYAGSSNGIYLSTNNGLNWIQTSTMSSTSGFFISNSTIYLVSYSNPNYRLFKSTNGGATLDTILNSTKYIYSIALLNGNYLLSSTNPSYGYISSSDNGATWLWPQSSNIYGLTSSGSNVYGGASDGFYRSTDGGQKWYYRNLSLHVHSITVKDNFIFAGTNGQGVYYTTNEGTNWTQTSLNNKVVYDLVSKDDYLLAGTSSSGVYYSTDNGSNWTQSSMTTLTVRALCVSDSNVYAGTITGGVYKSTNNGINWSPTSLIFSNVYALKYIGNKLYAGTDNQGVYTTTNNGINWTQASTTPPFVLKFTNYGSSIFASTNANGVYVTKNEGVNWTQTNEGLSYLGVGTITTSGNYIIAGTGAGYFRRYILEFAPISGDANLDSLVNVIDVNSIVSYILGNNPSPFSFLAADVKTDNIINVLDVVGVVNIILNPADKSFAQKQFTDNTGSAFLSVENNNLKLTSTVPVSGIQFRLSGTGSQNVNFTPSPLLSQYQIASGSNHDTTKTFIIFTMNDTILSAGVHTLGTFTGLNGGITIKDTVIADENGNGIITGTIGKENPLIPHEYSLSQNFPNPFNPSTVINFRIPEAGLTHLKIYDVTGRLIKTIFNEYRQPGYYSVEFNAGSLSSGIYFYNLKSGSYSSTKKMVLIR
jgi:hypothetical protein